MEGGEAIVAILHRVVSKNLAREMICEPRPEESERVNHAYI